MSDDAKIAYARAAKYRNRYGIEVEDYDRMMLDQGGACAVCHSIPTSNRRLCVDHDHETGEVRGLLCDLCNRTLGQAGDSVILLQRMIDYLSAQ